MYLRMNFLIRLIPDGEENVNIGTGCLAYDDYLPYVGQSIERESCLVIRSADDWFDCHQLKVVVVADLLFRISPKNNSDWKGQAGDDCRETN